MLMLVAPATSALAPAILTGAAPTDEGVTLAWEAPAEATHVDVYRTTNGTTTLVGTADAQDGGFVDADGEVHAVYVVVARNASEEAPPSNPLPVLGYPYCWPVIELVPPGFWWPMHCYWPPPSTI